MNLRLSSDSLDLVVAECSVNSAHSEVVERKSLSPIDGYVVAMLQLQKVESRINKQLAEVDAIVSKFEKSD